MNSILPEKNELEPITDKNNTFSECSFTRDFLTLSFEEKLQVVNDLVRQSLIPDYYFDFTNHTEILKGNCHTAVQVSIEYLKKLNIGKNYRYVLAPCRYFDIDGYYSKHAILLVDDDEGNTYQYDASPFVGYKYGSVVKLEKKKIYKSYISINENNYFFIKELEQFQVLDEENRINNENLKYYRDIIFESSKYDYLHGFVSSAFKVLSKYEDNNYDRSKDIILSIRYNKYSKLNKDGFEKRRKILLMQIKVWYDELLQLPDGKRKLELAQNIIQELKYLDYINDIKLNIYDKFFSLSNITPRILKEYGLTDIMIKPSAFFTKNEQYIRDKMVGNNSEVFGEYITDLSIPTEICGLKKMIYSHPIGNEYIRSMTGNSQIMLVKKSENELYNIKKKLRNELGEDMFNKYVIWSDGLPILWHPFVTNYIHSADNPSESCLHYLINYPEHQLMTRYMYPNKKLGGR